MKGRSCRQQRDQAIEELGPILGLELDHRRVEVVQEVSRVGFSSRLLRKTCLNENEYLESLCQFFIVPY